MTVRWPGDSNHTSQSCRAVSRRAKSFQSFLQPAGLGQKLWKIVCRYINNHRYQSKSWRGGISGYENTVGRRLEKGWNAQAAALCPAQQEHVKIFDYSDWREKAVGLTNARSVRCSRRTLLTESSRRLLKILISGRNGDIKSNTYSFHARNK